jgi:hypothetical protein
MAELSSLRTRVSSETMESETTLREALQDIEKLRTENESLQMQVSKERLDRDQAETELSTVQQELRSTSAELSRVQQDLKAEQSSTANLSSVLEEFQASKDRELQSTLSDLREQLHASQQALAEYKKRALDAEVRPLSWLDLKADYSSQCQLEESSSNSKHVSTLEKDLKDKTALIGKLRHEAVLANEHLTEALRRLRNSSNDTSVDRRLVTNVLLTFLTTPRADSKRFEMLKLISTILQWNDEERERAGLQRASASSASSSNSLSPPPSTSGSRRGHARQKSTAIDMDANESFSNLWVEYLLRESNAQSSNSTSPPLSTSSSLPPLTLGSLPRIPSTGSSITPSLYSPTRSSGPSLASTRRPSFSSVSALSSTGPSSVASTSETKRPG